MIFGVCAFFAVLAVGAIFLYMLVNGIPAIRHLGLKNILFGTVWKPVAENPEYGILYIILTSLLGTVLAALAGVPIGVLTAVYLAEVAEPGRAVLVRDAVEVLAGIPSVIYGLLGVYLLGPAMYRLERKIFAGSRTHQFTGGANLLSAVLVLAGADQAETAEGALKDYVQRQIEANTDYRPAEIPKLENALISRKENTLLLVVADDLDAAKKAVE